MVSNSGKLDRRTKQHTQFGVSLRVTVPEILPRQNRDEKKNNIANWMASHSAKLDRRTKQHSQFGVSVSKRFQRYGSDKILAEKTKKKT